MEISSDNSKAWRQRNFFKFLLDIFVWLSAAIPVLYIFLFGTPYKRGFFCDDFSLSYPYKPDTVSSHVLLVGGFTISAFVVVIAEVLRYVGDKCRHSFLVTDDIFYCLKGFAVFLVGFVIEQLIVQVSKHEMGVLRPNFFDVCKPNFNRTFCPGYITNYTCTGDSGLVRESRQSFPSGHSSFSMYVATFFCIYVQHRLEINFSYILKFFLQTGLVVIATLCGLSRIKDHKHHPSDVAVGFLLGISVAIFVYKMVGTKVLAQDGGSSTKQTDYRRNSHECDCSHVRFQESHTPLPLLRNDFLNMGFEKLPVTPLLTDSPFSVRRPQSMPLTSCSKTEDV